MNSVVRMQAEIVENYNGILIYTLKAEENSLCMEVNGALLRVGYSPYDLPILKKKIDEGIDFEEFVKCHVLDRLDAYANNERGSTLNFQFANSAGLLEKALEARSKRQAIQAKEARDNDAKEAIEALERQKKEEEALLLTEENFKEGKSIPFDCYKGLLIRYGIWSEVPIKTRGWINTNLVSIHLEGCKCKTKIAKGNRLVVSKSKSVWDSLSMLKTALEITE